MMLSARILTGLKKEISILTGLKKEISKSFKNNGNYAYSTAATSQTAEQASLTDKSR